MGEELKLIALTQGKQAMVDDDIYGYFNQFKWCAIKSNQGRLFHAARSVPGEHGGQQNTYMHHWIFGYPLNKKVIDHIDGDGLNNQRSNLRIISSGQNRANNYLRRNGLTSSKIVGVTWSKFHKKWRAQYSNFHLGYFDTEEQAGQVYYAVLAAIEQAAKK